jgi:hypothetical protein
MRKKLVFGIVLVLTLLLLMPSITAIHLISSQKEIELKENIMFPEIPEKCPLLFLFVIGIAYSRTIRMLLWMRYSIEFDENFPGQFEIIHPLGTIRAAMLLFSTEWWLTIWEEISNNLGWDWSFIN